MIVLSLHATSSSHAAIHVGARLPCLSTQQAAPMLRYRSAPGSSVPLRSRLSVRRYRQTPSSSFSPRHISSSAAISVGARLVASPTTTPAIARADLSVLQYKASGCTVMLSTTATSNLEICGGTLACSFARYWRMSVCRSLLVSDGSRVVFVGECSPVSPLSTGVSVGEVSHRSKPRPATPAIQGQGLQCYAECECRCAQIDEMMPINDMFVH